MTRNKIKSRKPAPLQASQRQALVVLCMAAFMVPFMGSALNLALPQIGEELHIKAVTLTWLSTAYLLSTAIFQIPFARFADLVGRKKVFFYGIAIFIVSCILSSMARSAEELIALRFVSGIGSAMTFGTNVAILTSIFPPEQRGRALATSTAVVYAALAVGPLAGGVLTEHFGWQSIFITAAVLGFVVLVMTRIFLKGEWIESKGETFDLVGSVLYGVGIAGLIFGFSTLPSWSGAVSLVAGLILLVAFVVYERRQQFPVFNVRLFAGNKVFMLSSIAALINYAATFAIIFMLSLYLQYVRGLEPSEAGMILIIQACAQTVFSLVAGRLSNRYEPSVLATTGMVVIVLGLVGLVFISTTFPLWGIACILILLGVGFGIFSSPNVNVIMSSVEKRDYSQASATTGTMRLTGQSISMGIAGMAISFMVGNNTITPELHEAFTQSMRITFSVFIVLCMVGIYASTARVKKSRQK